MEMTTEKMGATVESGIGCVLRSNRGYYVAPYGCDDNIPLLTMPGDTHPVEGDEVEFEWAYRPGCLDEPYAVIM